MLGVLDPSAQLTATSDRLTVDRGDDVAAGHDRLIAQDDSSSTGLDAGLLGAGGHLLDQQALLVGRQAELLLRLRTQARERYRRHAELRVAVLAGLDQLRRDAFDHIERD